jgi:hypothetical protein
MDCKTIINNILSDLDKRSSKCLTKVIPMVKEYNLLEEELIDFMNNKSKYTNVSRENMMNKIRPFFKISAETGLYLSCGCIISHWCCEKIVDNNMVKIKNWYLNIIIKLFEKISRIAEVNSKGDESWLLCFEGMMNNTLLKVLNDVKGIILTRVPNCNRDKILWKTFVDLSWEHSLAFYNGSDYTINKSRGLNDFIKEERKKHNRLRKECINLCEDIFLCLNN